MNKLTKEEKIDLKYGDPFLKAIASDDHTATEYYKMYVDAKREAHRDELLCCIDFFVAFTFLVLALLNTTLAFSGIAFMVLGVQSSMNARIERLWASRFLDKIFDAANVALIKKEKEVEQANEKGGKETKLTDASL